MYYVVFISIFIDCFKDFRFYSTLLDNIYTNNDSFIFFMCSNYVDYGLFNIIMKQIGKPEL